MLCAVGQQRTLMVDPPQGPLEPLASRAPSLLSAMQTGHVMSSCRPCIALSRTHRAVSHTYVVSPARLSILAHSPRAGMSAYG